MAKKTYCLKDLKSKMNYHIQVDKLNTYVKTYLAPSKIHGVGLFALRDIPKGQRLYANMVPKGYTLPCKEFNNLFPEVREKLLEQWPQIVNGSHFAYPTTKLQAYTNHQADCNYDAVNDVMLKDVEEGEEITENYKVIEGWEKVFTFLK